MQSQLMKAQKSFLVNESGRVVQPGDEFHTRDPRHYEMLGLAFPLHEAQTVSSGVASINNEASKVGPFDSNGGETGAGAQPSLLDQDQAPRVPRSKKSATQNSRSSP